MDMHTHNPCKQDLSLGFMQKTVGLRALANMRAAFCLLTRYLIRVCKCNFVFFGFRCVRLRQKRRHKVHEVTRVNQVLLQPPPAGKASHPVTPLLVKTPDWVQHVRQDECQEYPLDLHTCREIKSCPAITQLGPEDYIDITHHKSPVWQQLENLTTFKGNQKQKTWTWWTLFLVRVFVFVCVWVCVCVLMMCEGVTDREREGEIETESVCVCVFRVWQCVFFLFFF